MSTHTTAPLSTPLLAPPPQCVVCGFVKLPTMADYVNGMCAICFNSPPRPIVRRPCRHCGKPRNDLKFIRGLCSVCYHDPGILSQYPVAEKNVRYYRLGASGDNRAKRPLPDKPTDALPGSAEKIDVLAARAEAGQGLWHPDDAKYETATDGDVRAAMGTLGHYATKNKPKRGRR